MENDEDLYQNFYWTLLKMEWDPTSIDLDEIHVPSDNYCPIKHSNFYKGSLFSVCDSPFGFEMLNKIVISNNIPPPDKFQNETVSDYGTNSNDKSEFSSDKFENIYESIRDIILRTKNVISKPTVVEHSVSISDLSFDDTLNSRKNIRNNSIKIDKNKPHENTTCTEFDSVKKFWLKISENVPPPSENVDCDISEKSTSLFSCNNKQSLNDALINTSTDSAFDGSIDTVGEYYKFVLGAIHKSNSDFPIKNIDRSHPHSLSNISLMLYNDVDISSQFSYQNKHDRCKEMNAFVS